MRLLNNSHHLELPFADLGQLDVLMSNAAWLGAPIAFCSDSFAAARYSSFFNP